MKPGSGADREPLACPVCEHPAAELHWRSSDRLFGVVPGEFELYECPGCRLLFQDPARLPDDLADFYPPGYWWQVGGDWLSRWEQRYRAWMVRHDHLGFLQSVEPLPPAPRILDIGAGSGLFVDIARRAGMDAWGLEASAEAVGAAGPEVKGRLLIGDHPAAVEGVEPFDVVTMFHTLEHVREPFPYLKQVRNLLRKPGHLLVQVPNRSSWQAAWFGRRWYGLDCPRHLHNFSLYSLLFLLGRAGFRIRQVRHFSLRDNGAALVSSLVPRLDPIARRIRQHGTRRSVLGAAVATAAYFGGFVLAQPPAWLESLAGRGGTVMVWASWDV